MQHTCPCVLQLKSARFNYHVTHLLLQSISCSVMSDSLPPHRLQPTGLLSMEFSRKEYRSGQSFPSPGNLPNPGIKSRSPALQADYLLTELLGKLAVLTKESACNAGDTEDLGLIPGSGRTMYLLSCPGGEHGNLLQYSCLENTMDRGALWSYSPYSRKELDRTEATQHTRRKINPKVKSVHLQFIPRSLYLSFLVVIYLLIIFE